MQIRCTPENMFDGPLSKTEVDAVAPEVVKTWFATLGLVSTTTQHVLAQSIAIPEVYDWFQDALFLPEGSLYYI